MTLGNDLRVLADQADALETEKNTLVQTVIDRDEAIAILQQQLADCEGTPPPPDPEPWPTGGVVVQPGTSIASVVNANPAGTMFRLAAGTHNWTGSLPLNGGNKYIADNPANKPKIVGPGPGGAPFANATHGGIWLKGLDISNFGPANTTEGGAMINKADGTTNSAGVNWLIEDCNIGNTNNTGIRWGAGWVINRTRIHDCGRYAVHGGGLTGTKKLLNSEWVHIGYVASDNNRGGSKFAITSGIEVDGLWTHDIRGSGIWFDIKNENGKLDNVIAEDCTRMGINFEVSYGPFVVNNPVMRRCGADKKTSEGADWPIPGGMQLSMTPDVTITNPLVEDCRNGITIIQWQHPQVIGTIGSLDASRCGNENIIINGGTITNIAEFSAGLAGTRPAGTRPTGNIHYNNVTFDTNANFRSALHIA